MKTPEDWRHYFLELQNEDVLERISRQEASLILLVLGGGSEAQAACRALTTKLRGEAWEWARHAELFDCALAILAVHNYRSSEIDGTCLAYLTNKMLKAEVEVGGPYYDSKQKIDISTNLVISRLFSVLGSPLPNVETFLKKHDLHDSPDAVSTLLLGWPDFSFSKKLTLEMTRAMPYFAQSLLYKKASKSASPAIKPLYQIVSEHVYKELKTMNIPLRTHAISAWEMVNQADTNHEISMLSAYFADSLKYRSRLLSRKLYTELGSANFFTWMAYTIYDDFIDEEGQANLLPVANSMLRKALKIYMNISRKTPRQFREVFETFDKMDAANSWELAHCRYEVIGGKIQIDRLPAYSNFNVLADRAGGHILGPIILVSKLEASLTQQKDIKKGLEQFLIAKQLSDDLQDWRDDFQKGHISPVVAHFLKAINIAPGQYNMPELTQRMHEIFWSTGIKEMNNIILKHLLLSKRYFKKSALLNLDGEFFLRLFTPLEETAHSNELQYIHQQQFLATYSNNIEKNSD